MSAEIVCYRCGESLAKLTPPFSRRDMCPACSAHVHVCRMCEHFDPQMLGQCREEEAEEVLDKEKVNFCEWFEPRPNAFDAERADDHARAQSQLAALFGDGEAAASDADDAVKPAEDLFK